MEGGAPKRLTFGQRYHLVILWYVRLFGLLNCLAGAVVGVMTLPALWRGEGREGMAISASMIGLGVSLAWLATFAMRWYRRRIGRG